MERCEIKEKVIVILNNRFQNSGVDKDVLEYVDLFDDLGVDSITFISIVVEIEFVFNIIIPDEMLLMENFKNVNDIVGVIENTMSTTQE